MITTWAIIIGAVVAAAGACAVDMASQEIQGRLDRLPCALIRWAARRAPDEMRDELQDEWLAELHVFLHGDDATPVTRLIRGIWFALGLVRSAPDIGRELNAHAYEQAMALIEVLQERCEVLDRLAEARADTIGILRETRDAQTALLMMTLRIALAQHDASDKDIRAAITETLKTLQSGMAAIVAQRDVTQRGSLARPSAPAEVRDDRP